MRGKAQQLHVLGCVPQYEILLHRLKGTTDELQQHLLLMSFATTQVNQGRGCGLRLKRLREEVGAHAGNVHADLTHDAVTTIEAFVSALISHAQAIAPTVATSKLQCTRSQWRDSSLVLAEGFLWVELFQNQIASQNDANSPTAASNLKKLSRVCIQREIRARLSVLLVSLLHSASDFFVRCHFPLLAEASLRKAAAILDTDVPNSLALSAELCIQFTSVFGAQRRWSESVEAANSAAEHSTFALEKLADELADDSLSSAEKRRSIVRRRDAVCRLALALRMKARQLLLWKAATSVARSHDETTSEAATSVARSPDETTLEDCPKDAASRAAAALREAARVMKELAGVFGSLDRDVKLSALLHSIHQLAAVADSQAAKERVEHASAAYQSCNVHTIGEEYVDSHIENDVEGLDTQLAEKRATVSDRQLRRLPLFRELRQLRSCESSLLALEEKGIPHDKSRIHCGTTAEMWLCQVIRSSRKDALQRHVWNAGLTLVDAKDEDRLDAGMEMSIDVDETELRAKGLLLPQESGDRDGRGGAAQAKMILGSLALVRVSPTEDEWGLVLLTARLAAHLRHSDVE